MVLPVSPGTTGCMIGPRRLGIWRILPTLRLVQVTLGFTDDRALKVMLYLAAIDDPRSPSRVVYVGALLRTMIECPPPLSNGSAADSGGLVEIAEAVEAEPTS
jgi:hypothetical protein